jgi:hypothetical protein
MFSLFRGTVFFAILLRLLRSLIIVMGRSPPEFDIFKSISCIPSRKYSANTCRADVHGGKLFQGQHIFISPARMPWQNYTWSPNTISIRLKKFLSTGGFSKKARKKPAFQSTQGSINF